MKQLIIFIFTTYFLSAQDRIGVVNYGHLEAASLGAKRGKDFCAQLTFDGSKSYYVTAKDSLERAYIGEDETTVLSNDKKSNIYNGKFLSAQGKQVFFNKKTNEMFWNNIEGGHKYVKEMFPKLQWKILKEQKKLGKYSCTKATTFFRGRNYVAWFTSEIPIPFGPWKLNGLPGLILEAYDVEQEIYIYFKNLSYPATEIKKVDFIRKGRGDSTVEWWTIRQFAEMRIKTLIASNNWSKLYAKENNTPKVDDVKEVDVYIEAFN